MGGQARPSRPPDDEPYRPPKHAIDRIGPPPSGIRSQRSARRHYWLLASPHGTQRERLQSHQVPRLLRYPPPALAAAVPAPGAARLTRRQGRPPYAIRSRMTLAPLIYLAGHPAIDPQRIGIMVLSG